jgi:G2/mitotic-specific cyclin 1/2
VSILVREWALERWEEGEQVSLLAELPAIRVRNRAERERLAAAGLDGDEDDNS